MYVQLIESDTIYFLLIVAAVSINFRIIIFGANFPIGRM